ncbi:MAG: LytTR family DNA-binding domain-containing protein [Odoribacter sp.]|nr:LytTR family DNA-binding domain-containing protein [Odoribacter sp.]
MGTTEKKEKRDEKTDKPETGGEIVAFEELEALKRAGLPPGYVTDGFFVKAWNNDFKVKIRYADIVWIEAMNNYSHVHLRDSRYITLAYNLGKLEAFLPVRYFARINRSEIINIHCVDKYCGNSLHIGSHLFLVSESFRKYTFSCFNELVKKV